MLQLPGNQQLSPKHPHKPFKKGEEKVLLEGDTTIGIPTLKLLLPYPPNCPLAWHVVSKFAPDKTSFSSDLQGCKMVTYRAPTLVVVALTLVVTCRA